jgi:hypothetical protein
LTTEECTAEISYLKEKIEQLELDIMLLKVSIINNAVPQPIQPYQPWVSPQPYWQNPIITYCGNRT